MPFHTVGRGMTARIGPNARARVLILLHFARNLKIGNPASVKIVGVCGALTGKVATIGELGTEEQVPVELAFDQPPPSGVRVGDSADAVIEYGRIENTLFMERGGFDKANVDAVVFRVDPNGKQATRVNVRFGAIASEMIEIKSGLREGDKVIVTDMSRWENSERIRLD
jgi:multidrug efflux pump subunit AcrA (membrane-fusion protein)